MHRDLPSDLPEIQVRAIHELNEIPAESWNSLIDNNYPYLKHEFLSSLETTCCLGEKTGWFANHLLFESADTLELIAALPLYVKYNSFGEFVFDWSWADAYSRAGQNYYPKLVVASPFTPATGPRVLLHPDYQNDTMYQLVMATAQSIAEARDISSLHFLFTTDPSPELEKPFLKRMGCQFHWSNHGYSDFDDFLDQLTSKRRKQIRKERREVCQAGVTMKRLKGHQTSRKDWEIFHQLYQDTFNKHGNYPALTLDFFLRLAEKMPEDILLIQAIRAEKVIASAFFLIGEKVLYGRYWGCFGDVPGLHFETCYYQGIEFCIEQQIEKFEPGAQGEHKISRGFLPTKTWSLHWIKEERFEAAIRRFLSQEYRQMENYIKVLAQHSPFKAVITDEDN